MSPFFLFFFSHVASVSVSVSVSASDGRGLRGLFLLPTAFFLRSRKEKNQNSPRNTPRRPPSSSPARSSLSVCCRLASQTSSRRRRRRPESATSGQPPDSTSAPTDRHNSSLGTEYQSAGSARGRRSERAAIPRHPSAYRARRTGQRRTHRAGPITEPSRAAPSKLSEQRRRRRAGGLLRRRRRLFALRPPRAARRYACGRARGGA